LRPTHQHNETATASCGSASPSVPFWRSTPMEYRKLGNSGAIVTAYCLGTMTFGKESDEATSFRIMDTYVEAGGNFLDTADVYSDGASEEIIGRWLKGKKLRDLVIATKGRFPMGDGPNHLGLSRKHLAEALDASLRRLGVE